MATGGLGNLTVFLGLDAAEFDSGLNKSELRARRFGEALGGGIVKAAGLATAGLAALGLTGAGALALISNQVDSIAGFQDLADKIGDTASNVSALQLAADLSGTAMETVAGASVKLTASLSKTDDEAKGTVAALKAIGIESENFRKLSPVAQLDEIARSLAEYEDGASKTAVAVALFGKSGAELIPFLKDQAEQQGLNVRLTEDQIAAADEFSKRIARQRSELSALGQIIVAESVPAVGAFTGALTDAIKEALGLDEKTQNLKNSTAIKDFSRNAVEALGFIVDAGDGVARVFSGIGKTIGAAAAQAAAVAQGDLKGAMRIGREWMSDMDGLLNSPLFSKRLQDRLNAPGTSGAATPGAAPKPLRYTSPSGKSAGGGDDPLKRQLDNDLKLLESAYKTEEELLRDRNKMLDLVNGQNLISFADYYGARRAAAQEALDEQTRVLDAEIAKLQAYQSTAAKASERESAQGKINDLLQRKAKLQRDAATEAITLAADEAKAYDGLKRSMEGVNASILEMIGLSGQAAQMRFDASNADLRDRLTAQGDTQGLAQLDRLRQLTVAQADYNQRQQDSSDIVARLQIQEERVNTARNLGAIGELTALQQITEARRAAVAQQEAEVLALEAIARASDNPRLVLQAEQARAAWEKLRAESDLVAQKFDTIVSGSFGDAFADFISGTKSAKEAMQSFADSVVQQISRMVANDLATSLFSGLFGGSSGGGGIGGFFASLFGGGKAVGGAVSPGKFYEVNEQGPELYSQGGKTYLMAGSRGGRITPNAGGASMAQTVNIHLQGQVDARTQSQIAATVYAATNRAIARGTA
ncbi:hypothetical protein [Diaphorobacter sp.]|uniref:hypothetical protein n=1 Tax=Diaphorobacter sp. TaxID=1934310 RepID=UPI002586ABDA|nr:hypothetical protein [Diaphorobacter sp.]